MLVFLIEVCKKKLFCYKKKLRIYFLLHTEKPQTIWKFLWKSSQAVSHNLTSHSLTGNPRCHTSNPSTGVKVLPGMNDSPIDLVSARNTSFSDILKWAALNYSTGVTLSGITNYTFTRLTRLFFQAHWLWDLSQVVKDPDSISILITYIKQSCFHKRDGNCNIPKIASRLRHSYRTQVTIPSSQPELHPQDLNTWHCVCTLSG